MFYGLKKTARMRKEEACVLLFSVDDMANMSFIHPLFAMLLALCDGRRCRCDLIRLLSEVFDWEEAYAEEKVEHFLRDFAVWLDRSESPFEARAPKYDPGEFVYEPQGDPRTQRVTAPLEVAWMVTQRCPYDCLYCCVQTVPASCRPPEEMTPEQSMRFIENCVETGVQLVHLYGGEPFLRPDLHTIVKYLLANGVHLMVSTKLKLSERVVARLAEAGIDEIQVSIDSAVAEIADQLVGRSDYLPKAYHTIDLLRRFGIAVKVNTVVTAVNIDSIPQLMRVLAGKGVRRVSMARYLHSYWKHDENLLPGGVKIEALAEELERIAAETGLEISMFTPKSPREISLSKKGYTSCAGGQRGMAVDAAGNASFCDRMLPFDEALFGNVTRSSLLELWNSVERRRFLDPPDALLADTACGACTLKSLCNQRLRCAYRSFVVDGRLFGPDYLCRPMPPPPVRFF